MANCNFLIYVVGLLYLAIKFILNSLKTLIWHVGFRFRSVRKFLLFLFLIPFCSVAACGVLYDLGIADIESKLGPTIGGFFILVIIVVYLCMVYLLAKTILTELEEFICFDLLKYQNALDAIRKNNDWIKYHVFISCSENEEDWARMIASDLEQKGRKVFLPNRDIKPCQYKLPETGTAISQSIAMVIITSYENVHNIEWKNFETGMILQKVKKDNLLVVRADECAVPEILIGHTIIDTINHTADEQDKILRKWDNINFVSPESLLPVEPEPFGIIILGLVSVVTLYYLIKLLMYTEHLREISGKD